MSPNNGPTRSDLRSFLEHVSDNITPLCVADYIACEKLLSLKQSGLEVNLRVALAALLAQEHKQYTTIADAFTLYFVQTRDAHKMQSPDPARISAPSVTAPAHSPPKARRHNRKAEFTVGATILLALGLLVTALLPKSNDDTSATRTTAAMEESLAKYDATSGPDQYRADGYVKRTYHGAIATSELNWFRLARLYAFAVPLTVFGLYLGFMQSRLLRDTREHAQNKLERGEAAKRDVEESANRSGLSLDLVYHVAESQWLSDKALKESADTLRRLNEERQHAQLAVGPTVYASAIAGGRVVPVFSDRVTLRPVALVIDEERGGHPWFGSFLQLAAAWKQLGVVTRVFRFQTDPSFVRDETDDAMFLNSALTTCRACDVVICSREIHPALGELDTAKQRRLFPAHITGRAWLDPQPGRISSSTVREHTIAKLRVAGIPRFPMTDDGIVAMSRWFDDGRSDDLPSFDFDERSSSLLDERQRDRALLAWAYAASFVEDPKWDLVSALRNDLPIIAETLSSPRDLGHLLDWLRTNGVRTPEGRSGRRLVIPRGRHKEWRARVRSDSTLATLENDVHKLLLGYLSDTGASKAESQHLRWKFQRTLHQANLDPEAAASIAEYLGTPLGREAFERLRAELEDREEAGSPQNWPTETTELLWRGLGEARTVRFRELLRFDWSILRSSFFAAGTLHGLLLALFLLF